MLSYFKIYYITALIKTVQYCHRHKNRQLDQFNRIKDFNKVSGNKMRKGSSFE